MYWYYLFTINSLIFLRKLCPYYYGTSHIIDQPLLMKYNDKGLGWKSQCSLNKPLGKIRYLVRVQDRGGGWIWTWVISFAMSYDRGHDESCVHSSMRVKLWKKYIYQPCLTAFFTFAIKTPIGPTEHDYMALNPWVMNEGEIDVNSLVNFLIHEKNGGHFQLIVTVEWIQVLDS